MIKGLRAKGIIGVYPHERRAPQEMLINITLVTDTRPGAKTDDIVDCVDYDALAKTVKEFAESASRFTLEALANDLATLCLQEKRIEKVVVQVEKPGAVPFAESVGVEVERTRG